MTTFIPFFTEPAHKQRWLTALQQIGKVYDGKIDPEYGAALYLLTADEIRWHVAEKRVSHTGIDIDSILFVASFSSGEIILVKLAGNLLNGNQSISPREFTRLSEHNFLIALDAIKLRYYGGRIEDFEEGKP